MPRIAHIEIRTDPPQVSGSYTRYIIPPQERGAFQATHALNGESRASLTLPTDAEAWSHVRRMDCLRVVYEDGSSRSWRIADDTLTEDERTGELVLSASEILLDLADCRVLRNERTAGAPQLSRTYAPMTPREILADVLRELHDAGEALHIQLGVVEPTAMIAHERTWTTALEVVRAVAQHPQVACEYRLREQPDAFYLDLLSRVGADADPVHVWYRGDLGSLRRQRSAPQVASVVIPRGDSADVTCGTAVFEVISATTDSIRVRDPDAPLAPVIVFDGQFTGAYAIRPVDGALCQIVGSAAATQDVYVSGASLFAAGDLLELRRDASGNRLITRENPAARRARHLGGIGRVERVVPVSAALSTRNYVRNPFFREWALSGDGLTSVPAAWATDAMNARRQNVPGAPLGVSALLRPEHSFTITAQLPAGSTSLTGGNNFRAPSAMCRPGEVWEMRNVSDNALQHTVTITSVARNALTWAEPTPALFAASAVRLVLKGVPWNRSARTYDAARIYPPGDVTTFCVAAHIYSPAAEGNNNGLVSLQYRRNGGAWQTVNAQTADAWQTLSFEGIAHTPGSYYDVRVQMTGIVFSAGAGSVGTGGDFGQIAWAYLGEGAELPPHDVAAGTFAVPEHSGGNKLHRVGLAALLQMAPDRASYQVRLADVGDEDDAAVPADRFALGGTVWLHHDALEAASGAASGGSPVSARLLTLAEDEDAPDSPLLTLDSAAPDLARTLSLLLGSRDESARSGGGATPSGPWTMAVSATPINGGLVSGGGRYLRDQLVEVVAVPQPSYAFKRWTEGGALASASPTYAFPADRARELVAEFEFVASGSYTITATVSPAGKGTVTGAGVYAHGATVSVQATPVAGHQFVRWTDGGVQVSTSATYNFTALASRSLVAEFQPIPPGNSTISVSASPSGSGSVTGGGTFANGTAIQVQATPASGKVFVRWTEGGVGVSTSAAYTFTVTGSRALVAEFADAPPGPWTFAASVSPPASGTVSGTGVYAHGATVEITATPASGYAFVRWTEGGVGVSTNPVYSVVAGADTTLVAEFEALPPPVPGPWYVSATSVPSAGGTISGNASPYADGSVVTLTATATHPYRFNRWTEDGVTISTSAVLSFTADRPRTLIAEFYSTEIE